MKAGFDQAPQLADEPMNFSQLIQILLARKRIVLLTLFVTVATTTVVSFLLPKTYTGTASVLVDFKGTDPITGMVMPAQLLPGYMATQVDIISSHNVALKVVDRLKLDSVPEVIEQFNEDTQGRGNIRDWLADSLLKSLEVQPSKESNVIVVEFSGADPQFAAELANMFVQAYIQANLELRVEPALQQSAWFDGQLKGLRTKVEEAQKRLSDYQRETGLMPVALDGRLDVENARLAELSSQLVAIQTQTYDSITRQRQISGAHAKGKLGELPEILNNSLIQNMKAELARAEGKLAEAAGRVDRNHPQYISAMSEVQSLKQKIAAEIQTARGSMENAATQAQQRENELKKALAEQKARVIQFKQQRDRVDLLTREMSSAQATLDSTTQRANQIRLESQRNLTDIAVLNPAVAPLRPAKPKLVLNVALAIFLGTMLGMGFGFLAEMTDRRIRATEDIAEGLGLPVLAVITALPKSGFGRFFRRRRMA
ncbi:MAG: chain length determinant protein EpsF [Proteobacteria bacterium]|nr:chain length determinant protein EpsF [Pseudomonadota bacterium]